MASITAPATPNPRTHPSWRRLAGRMRAALAPRVRQAAAMVSATRQRYRRPALTMGGFGCIDAAAWHTFGLGAGLLTLGVLALVLEWLGGEQ
jgi:hypothetical protein